MYQEQEACLYTEKFADDIKLIKKRTGEIIINKNKTIFPSENGLQTDNYSSRTSLWNCIFIEIYIHSDL